MEVIFKELIFHRHQSIDAYPFLERCIIRTFDFWKRLGSQIAEIRVGNRAAALASIRMVEYRDVDQGV